MVDAVEVLLMLLREQEFSCVKLDSTEQVISFSVEPKSLGMSTNLFLVCNERLEVALVDIYHSGPPRGTGGRPGSCEWLANLSDPDSIQIIKDRLCQLGNH